MRRRQAVVVLGATAMFGLACHRTTSSSGHTGNVPRPSTSSLRPDETTAAARSTIVFSGHVLRLNASTEPDLPVIPGRSVVVVDQVFRAPPQMMDLAHDTITVLMSDTAAVRANDDDLFYVVGVMVGEGIVVREVRREPMARFTSAAMVSAVLAASDSANENASMVARSAIAAGVVLADVTSDRAVAISDSAAKLRFEHAPEWSRATITVRMGFRDRDSLLVARSLPVFHAVGGSVPPGALTTLTPGRYILWLSDAARLPAGLSAGLNVAGAYYILDARDVRPGSDSGRVARVLP